MPIIMDLTPENVNYARDREFVAAVEAKSGDSVPVFAPIAIKTRRHPIRARSTRGEVDATTI